MKVSRFKFGTMTTLVWGVALPLAGSLVVRHFLSNWRWVHVPVHSATEAIGAFAALTLGTLLLLLRKYEKESPHNLWVGCALVGMGLLDGFHATVLPGAAFVWLHSLATLLGGFLFALVWLPNHMARARWAAALPKVVALGATAVGVLSIAFYNALPVMVSQGVFTRTAVGMNLLAGLFFLVAAVHFVTRYGSYGRLDEVLYASVCLLFGTASLLFSFSRLWDADWWFWHVLRLMAYFIVTVRYFFVVYQRTAAELARTNRALKTLSEINQSMVRATDESGWLEEVCRLLVATGGYRLAWIGFAELDEKKTVRPVAQAGYEAGYLETVDITWADTARGRGPTGTAIRTGQPAVARNILTDAHFEPWRAEATKRGYASAAAFPLIANGRTLGSVQVYAAEPDGFDSEEVKLLSELAGDVAYGMLALRTRAERGQAEEALGRSEERYRLLVESVEDYAIYMLDPEGRVVSWNPGAERIKGYGADEIIGQHFSRFYPQEAIESGQPERELALAAKEGRVEDESWRVRKDGSKFWANVIVTTLRDEEGSLRGFCKVTRDLTEHRQAEQLILRQNALLEGVNRLFRETLTPETEAEVARTCLAVAEELTKSRFGFLCEVNAAGRLDTLAISDPGWEACRIPADQVTYLLNDLEPRGLRSRMLSEGRALIVNDPAAHPDWIGTPEGHPEITSFLGVPIQRAGRTILIGLGNKQDGYTLADQQAVETLSLAFIEALNRKRAEQEIRQLSENLERRVQERTAELLAVNKELEAFTYSVSHDLRAPLRQIDGFARLLLEEHRAALSEEARHWLDRVSEGTRQMGRLVDDLLNLTRVGRQEPKRQVTGLNSLVREALAELKQEMEGREIEWRIDSLPFVECDPTLMKQVFLNLLSNALKFTRPRKRAVIELSCTPSQSRPVVFVRDNGVGFSMKYADKLFGVFQRLHRAEDFEGTGVGLATVQRIIHKHGGQIWAEAELDQGATFYFNLGAAEEAGSRQQTMAVQGGLR